LLTVTNRVHAMVTSVRMSVMTFVYPDHTVWF